MKLSLPFTILLTLMLMGPQIHAEKPTATEIAKVWEYFRSGTEVVLIKHELCSSIAKSGPEKNNCETTLNANALTKKSEVYLWMNLFVPGKDEVGISVAVEHKGRAIKTKTIRVTPGQRYRTWLRVPTPKDGTYTVKLDQEVGDDYLLIGTVNYNVGEQEPTAEPKSPPSCAIEAGPLWSQANAEQRCPGVCESQNASWNGHWWTTVPGRMSVCQCSGQPCKPQASNQAQDTPTLQEQEYTQEELDEMAEQEGCSG